jgi:hypothetical protein
MTERLELVVLPAIAGHAHTLGTDGQPTCGCTPRVAYFLLQPTLPSNQALARLQLSSPRCERVSFHKDAFRIATRGLPSPYDNSKCDVGNDVPGGGAA